MPNAFFIAAISTDLGKTFFIEKTCQILRQKKIGVAAIKPIASGFLNSDKNSDSAKILAALGLKFSKKNLDSITPWRFESSTSPHYAAKISGTKIDFLAVKKFCRAKIIAAKKQQQILLIEGAGGVMTPISDKKTFLDLAKDLKIPLILLSANYLGSISQTLCAVEALKSKKVLIEKIIINQNSPSHEKSSQIADFEMANTIKTLTKIDTILLESFLNKLTSKNEFALD
jgi:dethiobiotin synthetase